MKSLGKMLEASDERVSGRVIIPMVDIKGYRDKEDVMRKVFLHIRQSILTQALVDAKRCIRRGAV